MGGGIVGCACAYQLASRGLAVTLLERAELAAGASGRNHGLLLSPLDPVVVPMARASTTLYERVAAEAPLDVRLDPSPIGFLLLAGEDDRERAAARWEAEAMVASGASVDRIEGNAAIRHLEPGAAPAMVEGWLVDDARRLDPAALTVALALLARQAGAEVRTHVLTRALMVREGRVAGVVTDDGTIEAGTVLVAAGPWSPPLLRPLGISLPVVGLRGWLVQLLPDHPVASRLIGRAGWHSPPSDEPAPPLLASDVAREHPAAFVGSLLHPNADGTFLVGGSRQRQIMNEPEDPSVPQKLLRAAFAVLPALADARFLGSWWGLRPATPHGRPFVGWAADGVVVATGHGASGVILGGGTAALVASLVVGEDPPFDPTAFDPQGR